MPHLVAHIGGVVAGAEVRQLLVGQHLGAITRTKNRNKNNNNKIKENKKKKSK